MTTSSPSRPAPRPRAAHPAPGDGAATRRSGGGLSARVDRFEQRHHWTAFPLAVAYKFFDDHGNYLAALITYYGFLSLFPLLLLLTSILGFVLRGNPGLQQRFLDTALSQFPVLGDALARPAALQGNATAIVIGGLVAVYGALGVAQAVQHATNVMWSVPRNRRPNPLKARLRSLLLIGLCGIAVIATTVLSALATRVEAFASLGRGPAVVMVAAALVIDAGIFALAFRIAAARDLGVRSLVPGAVAAAAAWQALQLAGTAYVEHALQGSRSAYGTFALVLGLFGWMYLAAVSVVVAVEINVVLANHLYPRALLGPFTDDVDLTAADRRAYTDAATAQRAKEYETIDVRFDPAESSEGRAGEPQPEDSHDRPAPAPDDHRSAQSSP